MRATLTSFRRGWGRHVVVALLLGLALAPAALAHARLVRSSPAKDAEISAPPGRLELWFNELLDEGFNSVAVFPASEVASARRSQFVRDKPSVNPKDRTHLTVRLEALAPGEYVVEWRVLSRDGHSAPGRFTFRVLPK